MPTQAMRPGAEQMPRSRSGIALALILVVAAAVTWKGLSAETTGAPTTAAGADECVRSESVARIVADPGIAPTLAKFAEQFNRTAPQVQGRCIGIAVDGVDARPMLIALSADEWNDQTDGTRPAAWIAESSIWTAALRTAMPEAITGDPESLVQSRRLRRA